jgi:hypothetical protein
MVQTEYLLNHIDSLLRLSYDVQDRAVSAKLREMADEIRIMVSVADIAGLAASLSKNASSPAPEVIGASAPPSEMLEVATPDTKGQPWQFFQTKYSGMNCAMACSRVGAP